ncbi:YopX family protein [Peribacillus simplex]|uniref:YopX family protein n=1 Tax=Peribacillus simplex TaxID=1478 RepID=UPI003D298633
MREIKFRAWDNVEMKMHNPGEEDEIHFYFDGSGIMAERLIDVEVCTPEGDRGIYGESEKLEHLIYMQYTGLKDKNDVEIYEGDLVSTDLSRPYLIVEFRNGAFMYQCHHGGQDYYDHMEPAFKDVITETKYHKVIGNIHENPELLNHG